VGVECLFPHLSQSLANCIKYLQKYLYDLFKVFMRLLVRAINRLRFVPTLNFNHSKTLQRERIVSLDRETRTYKN
jgi:hypothetical protein